MKIEELHFSTSVVKGSTFHGSFAAPGFSADGVRLMWKSSFPTYRYGTVVGLGNREILFREEGDVTVRVINMTPHAVNLIDPNGDELITFQPSGNLIRLATSTVKVGEIEVGGIRIPLTATVFGEPEGLPDPAEDTMHIVSGLVKGAVLRKGRAG